MSENKQNYSQTDWVEEQLGSIFKQIVPDIPDASDSEYIDYEPLFADWTMNDTQARRTGELLNRAGGARAILTAILEEKVTADEIYELVSREDDINLEDLKWNEKK